MYLYKYVFYERDEKIMLNVAVCDDSGAFLQEAEKVLRRDARDRRNPPFPYAGAAAEQAGLRNRLAIKSTAF